MPIYLAQRDTDQHIRLLHYLTPEYMSTHCAAHHKYMDVLFDCFKTHIMWAVISQHASFAVVCKYRRYILWDIVSQRKDLKWKPYEFRRVKKYLLPYKVMLDERYYTDDFCAAVPELIDWQRIKSMAQDVIDDIIDYVPMQWIVANKRLTPYIIANKEPDIDWRQLCKMPLPLDVIRQYKCRVNWYDVVRYTQLSDDLILYAMHKVPMSYIAAYQQISRNIIIQYSNVWPMEIISSTQKLSVVDIFELASILHAKHLAVNSWTSNVVLYSGASVYYLIATQKDIEQLRSTIVHSNPFDARKTADGCELRVAQCLHAG